MGWDLSPVELRVLGALIEKEAATPEQYPLSINALRNACNQKSSREPVMDLSESDVREAVSALTRRALVRTASGYGGRVSKFAHRFGQPASGLELAPDQVAVLCLLFLRGPQTVGELRARSARLHGFADASAVETTVQSLVDHPDGPLVRRLEREPGKREHRFAHCFGVPAAEESLAGESLSREPLTRGTDAAVAQTAGPHAEGDLERRVAELESAVAALQARIDELTHAHEDGD